MTNRAFSVRQELTALGPFFAADTHDPRVPPAAPWREMGELLDDPAVLAARVETTRANLASRSGQDPPAIELRVAASVMQLSLAARTLSPLLALAAIHGNALAASLRDLRWQPAAPSTFPLSIAATDTRTETPASTLAEDAICAVAAELCAITRPFSVSERVLRGNITSALAGAFGAFNATRPGHAPRARELFTRLLSHPFLTGTAQTSLDGRFQRRSCCLIYRTTPRRDGAVCGDCVLLGARIRPRTNNT